MSDLGQSTKQQLAALRDQREAKGASTAQAQEPESSLNSDYITVNPSPATKPPNTSELTPPTPAPETAVPSDDKVKEEEKPKEKEEVEQPDLTKEATEEVVEKVEDLSEPTFDFEPDTDTEKKSEGLDFGGLGSALNLTEITTKEDFIKAVTEKFSKLEQLETTQASAFEGLPDDLKQAMEVAKKGGDWKALASTIDVSKLDPIDLFEREFERLEGHKYKNEDGSIDYDALDQQLDTIPDGVKAMNGNQIKQQIDYQQRQKQSQVLAQAEAKQESFNKNLAEASRELPKMFPKDSFGIQLEAKHSSFVYDGIAKGSLIKKHLGNIPAATLSSMDANLLTKTIAAAEWAESIGKFRYKQGEVNAKKALLASTQNAQINTPSSLPIPEEPEGSKPLTSTDKLKLYQSKLKPAGSL
jgi:hypothetical protein